MSNRRYVQSIIVIALTLLVHFALWWLVIHRPEKPRAPITASRVTVLLFPTTAKPATRETKVNEEPPKARQVRTPGAAAAFSPVQAATAAASDRALAAAAEPAASEPIANAPLNLNLPLARGGQRVAPPSLVGEALNDPRTNTPRATFGERMARTIGTDQTVVEEKLNGGALRIRKGNHCVIVRPARGAQLDSFSPGAAQSAGLAESCD
jgi:hypothetical protein